MLKDMGWGLVKSWETDSFSLRGAFNRVIYKRGGWGSSTRGEGCGKPSDLGCVHWKDRSTLESCGEELVSARCRGELNMKKLTGGLEAKARSIGAGSKAEADTRPVPSVQCALTHRMRLQKEV